MIDPPTLALAEAVLEAFRARAGKIATAESCTGGLIAASLTAIAGSSDVVDRGFITYANAAKTEMLGVPSVLIEQFGAVSEEVARAMAAGALSRSAATAAIAVTGVAGPAGGSDEKPVGFIWFSLATGRTLESWHRVFSGDRTAVRAATVEEALNALLRVGD